MKRAMLIAGGTVGGLGAVLAITPPQLGAQSSLGAGLLSSANAASANTPVASAGTTQSNTPAASAPVTTTTQKPVTTKTAVKKKAKKKSSTRQVAAGTTTTKVAKTTATQPAPAKSTAPAPAQTTQAPAPAPAPKKVSGTFVGGAVNVNYGNVQVQITVVDGKITNATALQSPQGGRSGSISSQAIPLLRQETLAAQSSAIQGVGGASYTSYGWYKSLQSALSQAGLPL